MKKKKPSIYNLILRRTWNWIRFRMVWIEPDPVQKWTRSRTLAVTIPPDLSGIMLEVSPDCLR